MITNTHTHHRKAFIRQIWNDVEIPEKAGNAAQRAMTSVVRINASVRTPF